MYRIALLSCLLLASLLPAQERAASFDELVARARAGHGAFGERAAAYLLAGMPAADRTALSIDFLWQNLDLALRARTEFAWCRALPEAIFFDAVLPYANVDEPRHPWRAEFLKKARPLVKGCRTTTEAAQALNKAFFNLVGVHYSRQRERANQSPAESIRQGKASCTGLSILLVNACRAVGVPARVAGIANWVGKRGNHTWVEVWDGRWYFTGADEHDAKGLDRAWFKNDAAKARADEWRHAIHAVTWKPSGLRFPLVWSRGRSAVHAVNVTARYVQRDAETTPRAKFAVRLLDGRRRIIGVAQLIDANGAVLASGETKAGRHDWNDLLVLTAKPGAGGRMRVEHGGEVRDFALPRADAGFHVMELCWGEGRAVDAPPSDRRQDIGRRGLTRAEARAALDELWAVVAAKRRDALAAELRAKAIRAAGQTLAIKVKRFGNAPHGKRSLWISMHGGGGTTAKANDRQWQNQIGLYEPKEGFYVAPRAPTNAWNLWHVGHIDPLFDRLIEAFVIVEGVDPDRVYLMGYSAGGDGVYQLAPRMSDRFAAAAMMAGHPNETSPIGLRNLPFALFMGGKDKAYKRNEVAKTWKKELAKLAKRDRGGYPHRVTIYPEHGHWMKREDRVALPWMAKFTRRVWPKKIVWCQDDVTHDRFYWLGVPKGTAKARAVIRAEIRGQRITVSGKDLGPFVLRLRDGLVDLDRPVEVRANGARVHKGIIPRTRRAIETSLAERRDPTTAAFATIRIDP